ncbi:single-stranded-DNA-specific exonuclease RecJ [Algicola sagamiensis]|uniref:single-stranded-DNA-specific exonuclease RecJ n=1 Tax=Algicola sagamiensis TaxID=163869 RepID=UPI0003811E9B|nr:single-stranded-DNA-specific exonuclease RecJ [Algicola sagamiensis]
MQKEIKRRHHVDDSHLSLSIHPVLRQIYAARGVSSSDELALSAAGLADFQQFHGMPKAVEILVRALEQNLRVTIVGDFDCDGATSTAVLKIGLEQFGFNHVDYLVPNRFDFGYGLSPDMARLVIQEGTDVLITVDNGIACFDGVDIVKNAGIEVIITDHHLPTDRLPNADAIVNPNLEQCGFPSKHLAGVGVAFYVLVALRAKLRHSQYFSQRSEPNLADLLDLVALGTVADVVPLDANNRILVQQGLNRIRKGRCRPGIQALIEVSGRSQSRLVASDFGFALGPRLNAAGRLDDMSIGIRCLLADNIHDARDAAGLLDSFNKERREIEQSMQQEALSTLKQLNFNHEASNGICLYDPSWHQGIIGILAGRLKEQYHRPTIAFAKVSDSEIKGSARSVEGVHIRDLLERIDSRHPGVIQKFGGHAMAAGLSIQPDRFTEFQSCFEQEVSEALSDEHKKSILLSDGELAPEDMSKDFAQVLRYAGPWGQHFPEPVFDGYFRIVQQRLVGQKHLKLVLEHETGKLIDAIHFNADLSIWPDATVQWVHAAYQLDINYFRDKESLQLMVHALYPQ